jgi:hypothetical protein
MSRFVSVLKTTAWYNDDSFIQLSLSAPRCVRRAYEYVVSAHQCKTAATLEQQLTAVPGRRSARRLISFSWH